GVQANEAARRVGRAPPVEGRGRLWPRAACRRADCHRHLAASPWPRRRRRAPADVTRALRIGTRRSPLALIQTNFVADLLRAYDPTVDLEIVHISTEGDERRDVSLQVL